MSFILALLLLSTSAHAQHSISVMNKPVKLKVGESVTYTPAKYTVIFKALSTYKSECAVPGFNCGIGYSPEPQILPVIDGKPYRCELPDRPDGCKVKANIIKHDQKTFIELEFVELDRK